MRVYPAYARTLAQHVARGERPICAAVLLSSRWAYFNHLPKVCIKPDEWAMGRWEFSYLRGLHVVAIAGDECPDPMLAELLVELMRSGPAPLWVWNADGSKLWDDESYGMAGWIQQLSGGKVPAGIARVAERVMAAAGEASTRRFMVEYERIERVSGIEAAIQFHLRAEKIKARVRELVSTPYLDTSETAAA